MIQANNTGGASFNNATAGALSVPNGSRQNSQTTTKNASATEAMHAYQSNNGISSSIGRGNSEASRAAKLQFSAGSGGPSGNAMAVR